MTREEIENAFCLACCESRPHRELCQSLGTCAAYDRFIKLLKDPWHKVADGDLPKVNKYQKCVKVLVRKGDDEFVAFFSPTAGFSLSSSFYFEHMLEGIEYWMPIPEIKED